MVVTTSLSILYVACMNDEDWKHGQHGDVDEYNIPQAELVEDRCLSSSIESNNENTHLFLDQF